MIGEVCRFYGWTVEYVLEMAASRFFLMRESMRKIMSRELVYDCFTSRSAQLVPKSFEDIVDWFQRLGQTEKPKLPDPPENKPREIKSGSQEAMHRVMGMFAVDRRVGRHRKPPAARHKR